MRTTSSTAPPTTGALPQAAPQLPADLAAGLRRLKLATIRTIAPEVLITAKTQRWTPEEVLRTLIEAEIAARDASNTANRLKAAAFPVTKPSTPSTSQHLPSHRPRSPTSPDWNGSTPNPTSP